MKLVKTASGKKKKIKMSQKEWTDLGKKAGWLDKWDQWLDQTKNLSNCDKNSPLYQAILNPSLRSKFNNISPKGWKDLEYKVKNNISISPDLPVCEDRTMKWDNDDEYDDEYDGVWSSKPKV